MTDRLTPSTEPQDVRPSGDGALATRETEERLRELSAELAETNRRKDRFLAQVAHELRGPLSAVLNALQVLRQDGTSDSLQQQAREAVERQVRQMARLVDDLLETSRFNLGKLRLCKEPVRLQVIVEQAVETARPLIDEHGHELSVSLPSEPVWLNADPARLEQVFVNLLTNAAKYTDGGGQIWLMAERQADAAVVLVGDNGMGISADMLDGVFDMFTQVDRSLEHSHGGLGIGLSLVKHLTEMHGGSVAVRSDGPGRGSEFAVHLPILTEPCEQIPVFDHQPVVAPRGVRVLVVDDSKDVAQMLSLFLTSLGYEIRTAHDGLEAVETAIGFQPEVVLLDIAMPKLNGYDAASRIRQQPWGPAAVLVALTGWGQEEDRRRTREAGFNHHLTKPVEPAVLQALLAGLKSQPASNHKE